MQLRLWVAVVLMAALSLGGCKKKELSSDTFNVAFIYVGPVGDGGWTYAHDEGRKYLEEHVDGVHTDYFENVSEGAEAERLIRTMARKGYDLVITTSFGFMDATATVAEEFPDTNFISVTGFRSNDKNFSNLMGAMENMRYLAGLMAGERCKLDREKIIGAVEPIPIPEVIRLINAFAIGVRETCPDCEVHLRWTHSWYDPAQEKQAAESLLNAGAHVIVTGCDTTGPVVAAANAEKWGIGYDSKNACREAPERCLTATYWNWGPTYARLVQEMIDGKWKSGNDYLGLESGIVGLLGFEEGATPAEGVPESIIPIIKRKMVAMKEGKWTRFDLFKGPIVDNEGNQILKPGETLTQVDLEGIQDIPGREDCTTCMNWLVEGVVGRIPQPK